MALYTVLALLGLALLTVSADHLVLGSSRLASALRVSPVVVGVVVIGLGTSAPEFLVSGLAAAHGDDGIAVGNVVGSNIINVSLLLGVAALIRPMRVSSTIVKREVRLAVAGVLIFAVAVLVGLSIWTAVVLLAAAAAAVALLLVWARRGREPAMAQEATSYVSTPAVIDAPTRSPAWYVEPVRAVLGLGGVLLGAELLVANASAVATRLGVSQVVIGYTLVAVGTSVPELVTTIASQRRGESDLVVGNLFGSNLFNSLAGGAVIGFSERSGHITVSPIGLVAMMALTMVVAWVLIRRGLTLTRPEGGILMAVYLMSIPVVFSA